MEGDKELHVEYDGLVYKDTAVDVLYELTEDRLGGLDHQVAGTANAIISAAESEIKLMKQLKLDAESLKECTRYDAEGIMKNIKKASWDKILLNQQLLLQLIVKAEALCKERAETQSMLGRCSLLCTVAEDEDE